MDQGASRGDGEPGANLRTVRWWRARSCRRHLLSTRSGRPGSRRSRGNRQRASRPQSVPMNLTADPTTEESWAFGPPKVMKNASVRHPLSMQPLPFPCHPDRSVPRFPTSPLSRRQRMRLSFKESRTTPTSATNLERKSGGAERRDLRFRGLFVEMFSTERSGSGVLFDSTRKANE